MDITNVISWPNQVGYNELWFVISKAWGVPAELSTLFEYERADTHATQSIVSSHCEGLVTLVLLPLATYYAPTIYGTTTEKWLRALLLLTSTNETPYIANSFGIFTELQI